MIKNMIKDTDENPDEEILSIGSSIPVELGCATFPVHGCFTNPETLHTPQFRDFYATFIM